jgi:hypothetical protein
MYATIHGKPETPPVIPPPTRPPIVNEHQERRSDSDDEDGDWPDNGDSADHVGLAGVKSMEFDVGKDTSSTTSSISCQTTL